MALFSQEALNPGVRKREVLGWAMYDFANSGYTTVVLTAVFGAYFVGEVAGGADWATFAWTAALAASSVIVMLTMPALGAYADLLTTAALAGVGPGDVAWALTAVLLSNVFFTYGESLIAAFLPELARQHSMGRVSGWGWSFGYFGGMLTLGLSLAYVIWAQGQGRPASQFVPVTMLITAGIYGVAALATFGLLRERALPQAGSAGEAGIRASMARLRRTWHEARRFRDFTALLACAVAYQAGISVVIALAAVYAEQVLRFRQTQTMLLILRGSLIPLNGGPFAAELDRRQGEPRVSA
ncbi:MAG TPA: MFS transporter [Burkholderiaceae bacterium]|nr:MFS transporter [Burkholderiaceae bacterium]